MRFGVAVAVLGALSLFLARTRLGQAFQATSDDPEAAQLMGIDNRVIYAVALGLAGATIALAGVFNGIQTQFAPADGPLLLICAFGRRDRGPRFPLWGTLAGGVILGVAQTIGAEIEPRWKQLIGHLVFLASWWYARTACSAPRTRREHRRSRPGACCRAHRRHRSHAPRHDLEPGVRGVVRPARRVARAAHPR